MFRAFSYSQINEEDRLSEHMSKLLCNWVYVGLVLTLTGVFFLVTGLQFWMSTYMQKVLGAHEKTAAFVFIGLSFFGPLLGVLIGGMCLT